MVNNEQEFISYIDLLELEGFSQFDIAEAIYWFCNDNHEGQFSKEYEILCHIGFKPGALSNGPEEMAQVIYDDYLENNVVSVEELFRQYCKKYNVR